MEGWEFRDFSWILQICVCVDVSVNEPDGSIFTQFLLLVLPHFVELEEEGKDTETPDTGDEDTCLTRPKSAGDSPKVPVPCFVRLFAHKSQALTPAMDTGLVRPGVIPPGLGARDPHAATLCAGEPAEDAYNTHTDVSCQRRTVGPPPNHDKMTHSTYLTSHAHVVCL